MKLSVVIALFFSLPLLTQVASEAIVYLAVVSLADPALLTPEQLESVEASMVALKPELDSDIEAIAVEAEDAFGDRRFLRSRSLPTCNPCVGWPPGRMCYWYGRWRPACRRDEEGVALQVFKPLEEEELLKLNEEDRRRHLQVASMCGQAKSDVAAAIDQDLALGQIAAPSNAFEEHCVYDIEGLA